jgi:YD repeat-containing protein
MAARGLAVLAIASWLLATLLFSTLALPSVAQAQNPPQVGWCTFEDSGLSWACFDSPDGACYAQYLEIGPTTQVYEGYELARSDYAGCYWTPNWPGSGSVSYFCPQDGSPPPPGGPPGVCATTPAVTNCPPCSGNNGGSPGNVTPYPIDVQSGAKHFEVTDFANTSGSLRLRRHFNSLAFAGAVTAATNKPLGLANWLFDFQFELQIGVSWNDNVGGNGQVLLLTPTGAAPSFMTDNQKDTTLVPFTSVKGQYYNQAGYNNPQTDYTVSFVGAWPATVTAQSTTWKLTGPDDTVYMMRTFLSPYSGKYDTARPVSITRRGGMTLTLAYGSANQLTSITDSFGNAITFTWIYNPNDGTPMAIKKASLPGGYSLNYAYSTIRTTGPVVNLPEILTTVQYLDNTSTLRDATSYQYNSASAPYAVTDIYDNTSPTPVHRWGVTYDNLGRALVSSLTGVAGAVQSYSVAYPSDPTPGVQGTFVRTVTNPLGDVETYTYVNTDNASVNPATGLGVQLNSVTTSSPASTRSYTWGSDGFLASITDQNGNLETLTHDPRGMPNQTVEASGTSLARTTTTNWDASWREPDAIVAPTVTTGFNYNAAGAPLTKTLTDDTTFTTPYPTNGRTRTWTYAWNTSGQLTAVHGPRWVSGGTIDTTSYGYNASGYLQTIANALGQTTTVTAWDWRGAPLSVTDPNNVVTTFTYDIHGRLTSAIVNPGAVQSQYQFQYDAVGDLTLVTLPMGATLTYVYDAGRRMTKVTNVRGETRTYVYDNMDDPLSLTTENAAAAVSQSHTAMYDDWGRITQSIGAASQIWALGYDNLNNLTSVTDPLLSGQTSPNTRHYAFDALNRQVTATDPESHAVTYGYDPSDTLDKLTDARSLVTNREIDGFSEVIQEVSPDRGTRAYWYDASGNLTKQKDGDSVETDFTYDNAGRRITETFPSNTANNMAFTYDQTTGGNLGVGRLTQVTEGSGSSSFTYDAQGRIVSVAKVISGGGYTTPFTVGYGYDENGKVTKITYPSGDVVSIARTTDGLVTGVTQTPSGGSAQTIASAVTYEPFGPLAGFTHGNGLILNRTYDADYRLTGIAVAPASGAATLGLGFNWQPDGRLSSVTDPAGTGRAASYQYTLSGRVTTGNGPWGNLTYLYDAAGNRTQSGTAGAPVVATVATAANQITQTSQGGVVQRTLTYRTGGDLSKDVHAGGGHVRLHLQRRQAGDDGPAEQPHGRLLRL